MVLASAPFQQSINASTVAVTLPSSHENMDIKSISLSIVKTGSNDIRGTGFSNGANHVSDFTYNDGTNKKSDFNYQKCVFVQEYSGGSWSTKVSGTASLSSPGEIWFTFDNYDSNYNMIGIATGDIA